MGIYCQSNAYGNVKSMKKMKKVHYDCIAESGLVESSGKGSKDAGQCIGPPTMLTQTTGKLWSTHTYIWGGGVEENKSAEEGQIVQ